jgi:hypothetical protein
MLLTVPHVLLVETTVMLVPLLSYVPPVSTLLPVEVGSKKPQIENVPLVLMNNVPLVLLLLPLVPVVTLVIILPHLLPPVPNVTKTVPPVPKLLPPLTLLPLKAMNVNLVLLHTSLKTKLANYVPITVLLDLQVVDLIN